MDARGWSSGAACAGDAVAVAFPGMDASDTIQPQRELDARGLNCPLPILRTKKALNEMAAGEVLRILATDPGSVRDFHAFSRQTGHELLSSTQDEGQFCFLLRKKT